MNSIRRIGAYAIVMASMASMAAVAQTPTVTLLDDHKGNIPVADMAVDLAPGTISAFSILGISGDLVAPVENVRDLTLALKGLDANNGFGLSISPARTSFMPVTLTVKTYNDHLAARIWAGTTLSFGQTTVTVDDKSYRQRAWGLETSFYLDANRDDPIVTYVHALANAENNPALKDVCVLALARPNEPSVAGNNATSAGVGPPKLASPEEAAADDQRAKACRDAIRVLNPLRWNASRAWASVASGSYAPSVVGGSRHGLGRTAVLGLTVGIGDGATDKAGAITVAYKHTSREPVAATYALAQPLLRDTQLTTLRGAYGSKTLRFLLEASTTRNELPTASQRAFKRAVGLDVRVADGMWLTARLGRQRRVDNTGEETGATVGLSISPSALIKF